MFEARKAALPWVSLVKQRKVLHGFIMKMIGLVVLGKKSSSLNGASLAFTKTVVKLYMSGGAAEVVKYLSKCQLLLMQSLCSSSPPPVLPSSPRVATTAKGLPRIIPSNHRKMIRQGNTLYIQLWMTLFSLHRVLTVKGRWKIHTIYRGNQSNVNGVVSGIDNYIGYEPDVYGRFNPVGIKHYIPMFLRKLKRLKGLERLPKLIWKADPLLILTQGPNSVKRETSMMCIGKDSLAWSYHPLFHTLKRFTELTGMQNVTEWINRISYMVSPLDVSLMR